MHSRRLQTALTKFITAAASRLQADLDAGAEVSFELGSHGGGRRGRASTPLYCYQALTGAFIAERESELEHLAGYTEVARLLEGFDGLDRYLSSMGTASAPARRGADGEQARALTAITTLLADAFDGQTDFELHPDRLRAALERLERSELANTSAMTLVATLHGLTITSPELSLAKGLTIAHPDALQEVPAAAGSQRDGGDESDHLIIALTVRDEEGTIADGDARDAVAQGCEVLNDLLRSLRLFGDGRVALGALGWSRIGDGPWNPVALGSGGRPHGMLVVTAEQEDELRAFCNLVSRRAPHGNELAWALRRYELGCERESPYEALSDHLLALRVLLEPEGPSSGLLAGRLAALCAIPEQRLELTERIVAAVGLERAAITGSSLKRAGGPALAKEVADHLRALLRDVICGHLAPDLPALADELLAAPEPAEQDAQPVQEPAPEPVPA
jgi:hypothetical protein